MAINHSFSQFGVIANFKWENKSDIYDPIVLPSDSVFQIIHIENQEESGLINWFQWSIAGISDNDFCFECQILSGEYKGEIIDRDNFVKFLRKDPDFFPFIIKNSEIKLP